MLLQGGGIGGIDFSSFDAGLIQAIDQMGCVQIILEALFNAVDHFPLELGRHILHRLLPVAIGQIAREPHRYKNFQRKGND